MSLKNNLNNISLAKNSYNHLTRDLILARYFAWSFSLYVCFLLLTNVDYFKYSAIYFAIMVVAFLVHYSLLRVIKILLNFQSVSAYSKRKNLNINKQKNKSIAFVLFSKCLILCLFSLLGIHIEKDTLLICLLVYVMHIFIFSLSIRRS